MISLSAYQNALNMCPELKSLHFTLIENFLRNVEQLHYVVIQTLERHQLSIEQTN